MDNKEKCPLCDKNLKGGIQSIQKDMSNMTCVICGKYEITGQASLPNVIPQEKKYILSAVSREANAKGNEILIRSDNIQEIIAAASIPNGPLESIERILQYVFKKSKTAASFVPLMLKTDYPIAFARDRDEFVYFLEKAVKLEYLEKGNTDAIGLSIDYRLTLKGRERVDELRKK